MSIGDDSQCCHIFPSLSQNEVKTLYVVLNEEIMYLGSRIKNNRCEQFEERYETLLKVLGSVEASLQKRRCNERQFTNN